MKNNRRKVLKSLAALPFLGSMWRVQGSALPESLTSIETLGATVTRDYFKELGLRTFINAAGTYTSMTGCLMPKEMLGNPTACPHGNPM
ncbi:MAG: hypothetical protein ACO3FS_05910, partial [Flavobacteriaceae bacterium]